VSGGRARLTFLGTGTSHGVPMIGCDCATCRSEDPRDKRWRPSVLLTLPDGLHVLVDTATDLRAQALTFAVPRVDAVLFTHAHADHIFGLDELRRYNHIQRAAIPCYASPPTAAALRRIFQYIFGPSEMPMGAVPRLELFTIRGPFCLGRTLVRPVEILHGRETILGFRLGSLAYLTDCSAIPDESRRQLSGLDVLVLDALRDRPHPTHLTVADAVRTAASLAARATFFTHMSHDLPHAATCARLPPGMQLAYDGLSLEFEPDAP
jgi:phosphoribosyl 1,2-cyclic phosphate phosphodiesterase